MITDFYDKAHCLVLDKRYQEFTETSLKELKSVSIEPELFIAGDGSHDLEYNHIDTKDLPEVIDGTTGYPTWLRRPNPYNAWLCHKKMFKSFLKSGGESLLLLEDDVKIEDDFLEVFGEAEEFFQNNDWDMIYLGCYVNDRNPVEPTSNEHVYRVKGSGGFHGVIINKKVLSLLNRFDPIGPFDWITGQFIHKQDWANCFAINPCIISQKSGYSYVEDGVLDKPSRYIA
tara:strand:+ start:3564 stop:4250 length:687 start_codon:yes stop_codon:yes gene_type:complete